MLFLLIGSEISLTSKKRKKKKRRKLYNYMCQNHIWNITKYSRHFKICAILQEHRNTYITEEDFRFMSSNGLNAVRIPVGWWIAFDPNPPKPFVGGSLPALDNAFSWAQ